MCLQQLLLYNNVNQLYVYIYPLPLEPPSTPTPPHPSHSSQYRAELPTAASYQLLILHMVMYICFSASLSIRPTFSLPCCVHKSVLCDFISIPALQRGSSVPFSRFHIYELIDNIFLFLTWTPLGASRSCFLPSRPSEESKIHPECRGNYFGHNFKFTGNLGKEVQGICISLIYY